MCKGIRKSRQNGHRKAHKIPILARNHHLCSRNSVLTTGQVAMIRHRIPQFDKAALSKEFREVIAYVRKTSPEATLLPLNVLLLVCIRLNARNNGWHYILLITSSKLGNTN